MSNKPRYVFFGTPDFAVLALEELLRAGMPPALIVTAPDRPKGRGLRLAPPPVKIWAEKNRIPCIQPEKLEGEVLKELSGFDVFVVVAYGKILKKEVLDISPHGTLNVHPSLLPKFRGPSPVEGAILAGEKEAGVAVMLLDEKMDHGPVLLQEKILLAGDEKAPELRGKLGKLGGNALSKTVPDWVTGKVAAVPQDDSKATYTKLIKKEDGLIDPTGDSEMNWRKFRAYFGWPGTYFFTEGRGKKVRVIVKEAVFENNEFKIKKVLPEGGNEVSYETFVRGL